MFSSLTICRTGANEVDVPWYTVALVTALQSVK